MYLTSFIFKDITFFSISHAYSEKRGDTWRKSEPFAHDCRYRSDKRQFLVCFSLSFHNISRSSSGGMHDSNEKQIYNTATLGCSCGHKPSPLITSIMYPQCHQLHSAVSMRFRWEIQCESTFYCCLRQLKTICKEFEWCFASQLAMMTLMFCLNLHFHCY